METVADRLKSCRAELGWTQVQLAKKARLKNQSIIGALESGYRKKSAHIPAIAFALGVSALWLASGKGSKELGASNVAPFQPVKESLEDQVIKMLADMSRDDADDWYSTIKVAANKARKQKQLESDRAMAGKAIDDPPLGRRRTA